MESKPDKLIAPKTPVFRRASNFSSVYANACHFEPSTFDLKMIFSILDQWGGKFEIEQHTAVTVSWMEAKLILFFISFHVAAYEAENGKIKIPTSGLPPELPPIPEEFKDNPMVQKVREMFEKMREHFIADAT
jgi:hypothetical protein